jgi:hypothetical protein
MGAVRVACRCDTGGVGVAGGVGDTGGATGMMGGGTTGVGAGNIAGVWSAAFLSLRCCRRRWPGFRVATVYVFVGGAVGTTLGSGVG